MPESPPALVEDVADFTVVPVEDWLSLIRMYNNPFQEHATTPDPIIHAAGIFIPLNQVLIDERRQTTPLTILEQHPQAVIYSRAAGSYSRPHRAADRSVE